MKPIQLVGITTVRRTSATTIGAPIFQKPLPQIHFGEESSTNIQQQFNPLNKIEKIIMQLIALMSMVPALDKEGLFPHKEFIKLYAPVIFKLKTLDGLKLRCYWLPAVNIRTKRLAIDKNGKPIRNKTFVMGHGHTSSPTSLLSMANILRLLGYNVMLPVFRAHEKSGGYISDIGFHSGQDIAATCSTLEKYYPKQHWRYFGYSMGAAALMMSPKSLTLTALGNNQKHHITSAKFKEQRRLLKQFDFVILDSPYADFDLVSMPSSKEKVSGAARWYRVQYARLNRLAAKVAKRKKEKARPATVEYLFPDKDPAEWIIKRLTNLLEAFQHHHSKAFLGTGLPLSQFSPAAYYKDSPLTKKPHLLVHAKQDGKTLFDHAERYRNVIPNATYVDLPHANHSSKSLVHPTRKEWLWVKNPQTGEKTKTQRTYWQMFRDPDVYIPSLINFLKANNDLPTDILIQLKDPKSELAQALENPNEACLSQNLTNSKNKQKTLSWH